MRWGQLPTLGRQLAVAAVPAAVLPLPHCPLLVARARVWCLQAKWTVQLLPPLLFPPQLLLTASASAAQPLLQSTPGQAAPAALPRLLLVLLLVLLLSVLLVLLR